jgi:hypothetical protein
MSPSAFLAMRREPDRPLARDPRHTWMILEELIATGIDPERLTAAGRVFRGSSWERLEAALSAAFTNEQLGALRALYEWPGSWAEPDPEAVPFPPPVGDAAWAELDRRVRGDGIESHACVVLLYMNARARALRRFRALRHEA